MPQTLLPKNYKLNGSVKTIPGEVHGNPVQYSCLKNPVGREPGGLQSTGSQRVGHDWSDLPHIHSHEDLQEFLEQTPKKDVLFITGDWNAKVGNQEITTVTGKFVHLVQNEAGQRLKEFCQENALVIQQHKRRVYTWTSLDGQCQIQIDNILCSWRWRSYTQSAKTIPGADCGSYHELM